ncbi:lysylphosphatidylglycerol synthase domain-containing protein [Pusillimonas noertemannii]|uniref:Lysylphosphatidylglycerol synthase-like protein n=1 Tax=Pusillimonas noertemannii TaxID=305977 RepID=A0A2U1CJH8_9BURK|nr:lysylphosphatidylglycerol synthase domain-containing protein [Pusillimonas noertemannii]NYT69941.1 UPF0104 family protein [Pusillimonas noertemannii]PVY61134.1 hypothetical protein C7440_2684 [Pusillimonas noertemannii]TFL09235.1 UPF0104 family protein [Pusillimonas noertemannii]
MSSRFLPARMSALPWTWITRIVTGLMIAAVVVLLFNLARRLDWMQVLRSAGEIGTPTIAAAMGLAVLGHLVYTTFDLLAKRYAGTPLPMWKVTGIAALSYAMNLNLGVLVGGVAIRLRLYHRLGVRASTAARVVAFSTLTNWIGYGWLAGVVFMADAMPLPGAWDVGSTVIQLTGLAMVAGVLIYLGGCAFSRRRIWTLRGHRLELPPLRLALAQCGLAAVSWMAMGSIIYVLLKGEVAYAAVLGILLFCSIAALIAHIPGGLGVNEAIFVGALSGTLPAHQVLAAVLMYRILYCVVPLALAVPAYLLIEARLRR